MERLNVESPYPMSALHAEASSLEDADPLRDPTRLAAVRELTIQEPAQQQVLSRLNRLAQQLLGVPASALSLVADDHQVVAAHAGFPTDPAEPWESPLSHSFCQHVARRGEAVIVGDARQHPDLRDNLGVREHDVIAYAGLPLRLGSGEIVGAFCAIDHEPRQWTGEQLATLADLASVATALLEQRRLSLGAGMTDLVTGLPRQPLFTQQLRQLLDACPAQDRVAVVAADLTEFKLLNSALGHEAGDRILAEVGLRLERLVNARRSPSCVTRLAADTFLLAAAVGKDAPWEALEREVLATIVDRPVAVDEQFHALGARAATIVVEPGARASEVVANANAAIEAVRLLENADDARVRSEQGPASERLMIRNHLAGAERRGELTLHYQPLFDLSSRSIAGVEALVRWHHPDLGRVAPDRFVPVAESSGLIVPIGEWILTQALTDLASWRMQHPARDLGVSVNVAPEQLLVGAFADQVSKALDAAGVPPPALTLEITERTLGRDQPAMQNTLAALTRLGVHLSLDDFGTGYSSLRRLTASPLDELKLDREFVADLATDQRRQGVISGITAMSHALGMQVVAEGIETAEQLETAAILGCTHGQGYYLARPAPAEDVAALLRGR
jgi:diguanylate cyclase (GGDEF)-like protein